MNEPQTLDEVMTDEAEIHARMQDNLNVAARNALRAELREPLRALRESHDALVEAAQRVKATLAWGLADSRVEEGTAAFLSAMVADLSAALEKARAAAMEAQG